MALSCLSASVGLLAYVGDARNPRPGLFDGHAPVERRNNQPRTRRLFGS